MGEFLWPIVELESSISSKLPGLKAGLKAEMKGGVSLASIN
jgi:hypothetical protein